MYEISYANLLLYNSINPESSNNNKDKGKVVTDKSPDYNEELDKLINQS
uniref:Uncharacterized protein n=1 Tax=Siphoviridae sp. ctGkF12 TaxID=2826224 RepID=A0A8S5M8I8_9CAUD|nr:MAG TPA: hypothetical protein [Siphoviridae sp. ctGkF12]